MPVLLLARGDQESKTMLRHAIEARYGLGPPAIDTLKLELKGRVHAKIGPIATWIPLEGVAYFRFPLEVRWNFTTRQMGVALASGAEAFDGQAYRKRRGRDQATTVNNAEEIASARARLWAISALILTPLTEHYVELKATGENSLEATHNEAGVTTRIHLNGDHTLDYTATDCYNPDTKKQQTYSARVAEGQAVVGELMLPRKVSVFWDEQAEIELSPTAVEINPAVDEAVFRLETP